MQLTTVRQQPPNKPENKKRSHPLADAQTSFALCMDTRTLSLEGPVQIDSFIDFRIPYEVQSRLVEWSEDEWVLIANTAAKWRFQCPAKGWLGDAEKRMKNRS
jgi:hypothetical protein